MKIGELSFIEWLYLVEAEGEVRAFLKPNPKDPSKFFAVLYGNTMPIKDALGRNGLGFNYFKGTWSIPAVMLNAERRQKLQELGVDLSGLDAKPTEQPNQIQMQPQTTQASETKTDQMLAAMKKDVDKALDEVEGQTQGLLKYIDQMIDKVANSTDEAAKQEFITNFLNFASKFHAYSLNNQLLIWIQSHGKADHVAGAQTWVTLGRMVKDWNKGMTILAYTPKKFTKNTVDAETGEAKPEIITLKRFKAVKVYDVSATEPIPGHPKPFKPMERKDWSKDTNENQEEITAIVNALLEGLKEGLPVGQNGVKKVIDFGQEEMKSELGGYSAGGKIRVNDTFKGINFFSTLVHETAHELLHWMDNDEEKRDRKSSRKQREIDAETTSYIVLHHFGFETKDTSNYLALWQAKGDEIKERRSNIQKAAKIIIEAIKTHMTKITELPPEEETMSSPD